MEHGRIAAIEAAPQPGAPMGGFVLPGLIDMHVHQADDSIAGQTQLMALLYLAHGVTTVRDTGAFGPTLGDVRDRVVRGELPGPRMFGCGPIHDGDPPIWPGSVVVHDHAEGVAAARAIREQGWSCVKVYERLSAEALAGLREGARSVGLPLVGHVPSSVDFAEAGLDDVQHLRGVIGRTPAQPDVGERLEARVAQWEELDADRIAQVVDVSRRNGVAHTPTVVMLERGNRLDAWREQAREPALLRLPRFYAEASWNPEGAPWFRSVTPEYWRRAHATLPAVYRLIRALHEGGVTLQTGTDVMNPFVVPGASLHEELHHFVRAGISPEAALAAATVAPGRALPEPGLGTVAVGAPADLLLFREDPTLGLDALETLEAVVADGRLYRRSELDAALAQAQAFYRGRLYDTVSMTIAQRERERVLEAMRATNPGEEGTEEF